MPMMLSQNRAPEKCLKRAKIYFRNFPLSYNKVEGFRRFSTVQ